MDKLLVINKTALRTCPTCLSAAKGLFEFVTKAFASNEQDRPECCQLGLLCAVEAGIAIA